jgi:hypothetical protein
MMHSNGVVGGLVGMPRKRRRTKAQIETDLDRLLALAEEHQPLTVRGGFYLYSTRGFVVKTEAGYDQVQRDLLKLRRTERMPYEWISDSTRWMRKPKTYSSKRAALLALSSSYRRALWDSQDVYVEVWCEKDALAGTIMPVTREWDVPLMVSRGFASETYCYEAAMVLAEQGKPCFIYYLGDHDPSGVLIDPSIEEKLRRFAPDADISFERLAVLPWQIKKWGLPTRPTKRVNNSHAKRFKGDSVELDAIPPAQLRALVREVIEEHIDQQALQALRAQEERERQALKTLAALGLKGQDQDDNA